MCNKKCTECNFYQSFYTKKDNKFFITNYGYRRKKISVKYVTDSCNLWEKQIEKTSLKTPSEENIKNAITFLFKMIDNIGFTATEQEINKPNSRKEDDTYDQPL